ncbi:PTS lactose/cellobiose transporter subunit IIA [Vibrio scophthalmi]|uniref:Protein-N(Pi)-phosphohistidine--sugar phosphotransferase n=1 Tax=Vibrio scophthalmi TaxID=45658 RepID=A0A1E3WRT6_9VIBR|nr:MULTISPECIES: PTS lactose/cellobiose transporter subunit IIA [Vibrio]EGU34074.1 PTS system, lactose/cellobiose specific IIA subunit [Vibrio sp. N418]MCY9804688.1 PTS lactose/cellobiose transporter subunit IIA [Vibrio scophthalmi]ODS12468.1 Protein-N(pi)-phosphohistidine--sugar phosphotransferase [Vibrio scophthalmi]
MNKDQYEEWVMSLIVQAGQCRSMLMNAMREARAGHFSSAEELITGAKQALKEAHHIQTQLIEFDEGEGKLPVHIVMVHAQDHLMNAVLLMDMAEEIIDLRKVNQA